MSMLGYKKPIFKHIAVDSLVDLSFSKALLKKGCAYKKEKVW